MPKFSRRLKDAIRSVLEYNPPHLYKDYGPYTILDLPITFYDKHLDPRLALQRVLVIPSLTRDISLAADRALDAYKHRTDVKLPSVDREFPKPGKTLKENRTVVDARSVGRVYQDGTAIPASALASMLLLHPNSPYWSESLLFLEYSVHDRRKAYDALNEDYVPKFIEPYSEEDPESVSGVSKKFWESMDEVTQKRYREAHKRFPIAAVWQIFFVRREARRALKRMETLLSMRFPTFCTMAPGYEPGTLNQPSPPDAKDTAWGTPVATFVKTNNLKYTKFPNTINTTSVASPLQPSLRRSTRISNHIVKDGKDSTKSVINKTKNGGPRSSAPLPSIVQPERQWSDVAIPIPTQPRPTISDDEMAIAILQHAWARAVERDSTFIVLHCGTYERIAFRHRSSQTLFLSELIDVENCSDPGYGAIHAGLFISIITDVFDRIQQLEDTELTGSSKKRKRKQSLDTHETSKRLKTRSTVALETAKRLMDQADFEVIRTEVSHRQLALVRIQHHQYNSSSPASFLRCTPTVKELKSTYKPKEYFVITLTSQIGDGATGDAHAGVINLLAADGTTRSFSNVVVKFAFHADQRQRIRHELKVYQHLESSGVTGIPYVFGLFKDAEGDTLALVMTNAGKSLANRRPDPRKFEFSILKEERDRLVETLKSIHAAGVRHRDIRAENLVIGDDGAGNIIDFDRAKLDSSELTMKRELEHLASVLDGRDYSAGGVEFITKGSFRDSGYISVDSATSGWEDIDENSNLESLDSDETGSEDSDVNRETDRS